MTQSEQLNKLANPPVGNGIHVVKFARRAYAVGENFNDMTVSPEEALSFCRRTVGW